MCRENNSAEHKGLFLLSFLGIGTGSLVRLSPDDAALTASHVARVRATPPGTWKSVCQDQTCREPGKSQIPYSTGRESLRALQESLPQTHRHFVDHPAPIRIRASSTSFLLSHGTGHRFRGLLCLDVRLSPHPFVPWRDLRPGSADAQKCTWCVVRHGPRPLLQRSPADLVLASFLPPSPVNRTPSYDYDIADDPNSCT